MLQKATGFDFVRRITYFEDSQSSLLMCLFLEKQPDGSARIGGEKGPAGETPRSP